MLFSSLNTGRTDLRDTEVQQPNTAATLSLVSSSRAFSANSGQFDAGSTTTASTFLPNSPPCLLRSSTIISTVSFSVVSLIAIVPDSECSTPILIVSWLQAGAAAAIPAAMPAATAARRMLANIPTSPSLPLSCCAAVDPADTRVEQDRGQGNCPAAAAAPRAELPK